MQRYRKHDVNVKYVEPDSELLAWERWVQIRKDETTHLAKMVMKPPADLAMNQLIKQREEQEWKTVIELAKIEPKPSIRGNLWEQPFRLKQSCYCKPVYESKFTPAQLGKPPVLEHICVPKEIQATELGLAGKSEKKIGTFNNLEFVKYRKKREQELGEKLKKIDPFKPSCSELMIRGGKPKTPPKKLPLLPEIRVTEYNVNDDILCTVYAIRINNTIIFKDIPGQSLQHLHKMKEQQWHEACTNWSYYFNTPIKRAGRSKVYLENLGTVALRYCWKKIKKPLPFIPEEVFKQVFFFNKNEDVISPGQKKEIFFTFVSPKPGIFSECWELSFINICFFDSLAEKIYFNMYGDATENLKLLLRKNEVLKVRIETKAIYNIVISIIEECFTAATTVIPQQYPYKHLFLEAELFVMKNPVCFYHQTEVNEMKKLYTEMVPNTDWDLSISTWRQGMISLVYEDRMKYFDLLKKSHRDLLKPWYEGEALAKEKHRTIVFLLGRMADKFDIEYQRLLDIYCTKSVEEETQTPGSDSIIAISNPAVNQIIYNIFYLTAYEIVATAIEQCAGVLSSLDLNRWVDFDFCQLMY